MGQDQVFLVEDTEDVSTKKPLNIKRLTLLIVVLFVLVVVMYIIALPDFYVQEILIKGNRITDSEEVLYVAEIHEGDHLFSHIRGGFFSVLQTRNAKAEHELKNHFPYIKDVVVRVDFPSTVVIEIDERLKMAYVEVSDGYAIIDTEGYVLELNHEELPQGIPLIQGVTVESASLGANIVFTQQYGFDHSLVVLSAIYSADAQYTQRDDALMSYVRSIRYVDGGISFLKIELPISNRLIHVKIGSLNNIIEDMTWLRHAVLSGVLEDATGSLLDMTGTNHSLR